MIESPFGCGFGFASKLVNEYDESRLFEEEVQLLSEKAVIKRRREFCLGRMAAHSALEDINRTVEPIKRGKFNEPIWPKGIVGAITHSGDIAISAVAPCDIASGIGIDIEYLNNRISIDIAKKICTKEEYNWVMHDNTECHLRMLMVFSAKETVFKAFFPMEYVYLDFSDVQLNWSDDKFKGTLIKKAGNSFLEGYCFDVGYKYLNDYVFTYMHLPPINGFK